MGGTFQKDFSSVTSMMVVLFQCTTGGRDWGETYDVVAECGTVAAMLFLVFTGFFFFAFFNIITSIFVDKVVSAAQPDREEQMLEKRRKDLKVALELKDVIANVISDGNKMISEADLSKL